MRLIRFSYKEAFWELSQPIPLQEVNLLVGKNAVGKSKVIEAISKIVNYILQLVEIREFDFLSSSTLEFEDNGSMIKYQFAYADGVITEEKLRVDQTDLLERNTQETLLHGENINPPENKLTLHVRRDTKQYPYFEKIVSSPASSILITSVGENSLSKRVDVTLRMTTREKLYSNIGSFSSSVSIMLIFDLLYSAVFHKDYEQNFNLKKQISKDYEPYRVSSNEVMNEE